MVLCHTAADGFMHWLASHSRSIHSALSQWFDHSNDLTDGFMHWLASLPFSFDPLSPSHSRSIHFTLTDRFGHGGFRLGFAVGLDLEFKASLVSLHAQR